MSTQEQNCSTFAGEFLDRPPTPIAGLPDAFDETAFWRRSEALAALSHKKRPHRDDRVGFWMDMHDSASGEAHELADRLCWLAKQAEACFELEGDDRVLAFAELAVECRRGVPWRAVQRFPTA